MLNEHLKVVFVSCSIFARLDYPHSCSKHTLCGLIQRRNTEDTMEAMARLTLIFKYI